MVGTSSLFNQVLCKVPRGEFARLVDLHGAERHSKGFPSWCQFVSMLFCHLGHAQSLREICYGLACCTGKLGHLGLKEAPKRSTLAYANANRPAAMYEQLFFVLLERFRAGKQLSQRAPVFRFKNKLLSLDSTTISLCLSLFPWADYANAKGGVKAHVLLDHADLMPRFVQVTDARAADTLIARKISLSPGSIVVMDCAYSDATLFTRLQNQGVYFVTRLHPGTCYEVLEEHAVPPRHAHLLKVQTIQLSGPRSGRYARPLRYVQVWDAAKQCTLAIITNNMALAGSTIAEIYRQRWQIEIFFKTLKQHLRIKTFVGTSHNALLTQIWTALIALLILRWLHHLSKAKWSLSNLATMLRLNLFTYRPLALWLDKPWNTPPSEPPPQQLLLSWTAYPP